MNGVCHELWVECNVMPDKVGLIVDDTVTFSRRKRRIAWYEVRGGLGIFLYAMEEE